MKEDGSGCNQLPSQTADYENDGTFDNLLNDGLHLTLLNNVFDSNNYNDSLIKGYCSYVKIENCQFLNNIGNVASGIHIDSSHVLINNVLFDNNDDSIFGCIYDEDTANDRSNVHIANSTFTNNIATTITELMAPELVVTDSKFLLIMAVWQVLH